MRLEVLDCRRDCTGACCRSIPIPPYTALELCRIPEPIQAQMLAMIAARPKHGSGPCAMLAPDNSCTIYANRPGVCRDFVPGSAPCLAARKRHGGHDERSPGSSTGGG